LSQSQWGLPASNSHDYLWKQRAVKTFEYELSGELTQDYNHNRIFQSDMSMGCFGDVNGPVKEVPRLT